MRKDEGGTVWILAIAIGVGAGLVGQYVSDVVENVFEGKTGADIFTEVSPAKHYLASAIGGGIAAIPGLNIWGTVAVGAVGNVTSDYIKGNIKSGKDIFESAAWGAGANAFGFMVAREMAVLRVKKINSMTRASQKNYINTKIYRGSQASININYHIFMDNSPKGKIEIVERTLSGFRSGLYSTMVSAIAGFFRR